MMLGESNAQQGEPLQADLNMQRTYQPSATAIVRLPMQAQMSIMAEFWVNYNYTTSTEFCHYSDII